MLKRISAVLTLTLFAAACADQVGPTETVTPTLAQDVDAQSNARAIPGQYIVVFNRNVNDAPGLARQLGNAHGARVGHTYSHAIKGFSAQMSDAAAAALARNPNVAYVEQDQEMFAIASQTIGSSDNWGLDRIDATSGTDGSYTYAGNGNGITVYIIDTGILLSHNEFGGRATAGFTAINDGNGTNDCNGHGTHVAGTVGGTVYGVAKGVTLKAVRVLDCGGSGSNAGVIAGVDWVTTNHGSAKAVANMSLGGGASTALDDAVRASIASGVSYALAAGNGDRRGRQLDACGSSPARVTEGMTIGATSISDAKASWSNYGDCVDWFAPGVGIRSSWIGSNTATNSISGTSMATPHVAGVAALYLQANPNATPAQLRNALYDATTKNIVSNSSTANNHLLYSPPGGWGGGPPPPPPVNNPPVASFTSSCNALTCAFTNTSMDSDGSIASSAWNFGDGATSSSLNPSRTYGAAGTYTVTLIVTDNNGATSNIASATVTVSEAPPPPPPAEYAGVLTGNGSKTKGSYTVNIAWSGFTPNPSTFDIYVNGSLAITKGGSTWTDTGKGGGNLTYQVCEAGSTARCTNPLTISP